MADVLVVGHICLDVLPELDRPPRFDPGNLYEVGPAGFSPGGGAANVALALDRLGVSATIMGQVGDDAFGRVLRDAVAKRARLGRASLAVTDDAATSYSIVLSHPDGDRIFLHHPGCNATFDPAGVELPDADPKGDGPRALYFGYPPLMATTYRDGGTALADLLRRGRERGMTTVLDMAMPDPDGPSGSVDWRAFLATVLPEVDLFVPSAQEAGFMLEGRFPPHGPADAPPTDRERSLSQRFLDLGAGATVLTLGERGILLATSAHAADRLPGDASWNDRELWAPSFMADVVGTTGAGDATTSGLIAAVLRGLSPERSMTMATAVAACAVEAADAVSGVRGWEETERRVGAGWSRSVPLEARDGWNVAGGVFRSDHDGGDMG